MIRTTRVLLLGLAGWLAAAPVDARQYVYPSRGQSSARQARDESECYVWATKQTGFDPAKPAPAPVSPDTKVTGSGARVVGGAVGAVISGASGGSAGTGALIGAAGGGLTRRLRGHRAADAENERLAAEQRARQTAFDQARTACLSGRGYSVK
jgi:hypothetical protein